MANKRRELLDQIVPSGKFTPNYEAESANKGRDIKPSPPGNSDYGATAESPRVGAPRPRVDSDAGVPTGPTFRPKRGGQVSRGEAAYTEEGPEPFVCANCDNLVQPQGEETVDVDNLACEVVTEPVRAQGSCRLFKAAQPVSETNPDSETRDEE